MSDALDRLVEIRSLIEKMEDSFGSSGLSATESEVLQALTAMGIAKANSAEVDRVHCHKTRSKVSQTAYRRKLHALAECVEADAAEVPSARV